MNRKMRTTYPPAFKKDAVARAKAGDRSVRSLEQELGLSPNLLRQWVQVADARGENAFVRPATQAESRAEGKTESKTVVAGLRTVIPVPTGAPASAQEGAQAQRIAQLEQENAILKKVLTLLSAELL
jgi:transposase-like protein